jgi:hypothetical protein
MSFETIQVAGRDAIARLEELRSRYPSSRKFPFLIGDIDEMDLIRETAEFDTRDTAAIIEASFDIDPAEWIAQRRSELEAEEPSAEDFVGEWPGEVAQKGSTTLHLDLVSGKIKPEVYLGVVKIEQPWHLPAVLKYGAWNDCPEAAVHCAFHRHWQATYGAQITGMSGSTIECAVSNPPLDKGSAIELAWEQYWYCSDIVTQGCETINNLAATLMESPYWFFWWD